MLVSWLSLAETFVKLQTVLDSNPKHYLHNRFSLTVQIFNDLENKNSRITQTHVHLQSLAIVWHQRNLQQASSLFLTLTIPFLEIEAFISIILLIAVIVKNATLRKQNYSHVLKIMNLIFKHYLNVDGFTVLAHTNTSIFRYLKVLTQ